MHKFISFLLINICISIKVGSEIHKEMNDDKLVNRTNKRKISDDYIFTPHIVNTLPTYVNDICTRMNIISEEFENITIAYFCLKEFVLSKCNTKNDEEPKFILQKNKKVDISDDGNCFIDSKNKIDNLQIVMDKNNLFSIIEKLKEYTKKLKLINNYKSREYIDLLNDFIFNVKRINTMMLDIVKSMNINKSDKMTMVATNSVDDQNTLDLDTWCSAIGKLISSFKKINKVVNKIMKIINLHKKIGCFYYKKGNQQPQVTLIVKL